MDTVKIWLLLWYTEDIEKEYNDDGGGCDDEYCDDDGDGHYDDDDDDDECLCLWYLTSSSSSSSSYTIQTFIKHFILETFRYQLALITIITCTLATITFGRYKSRASNTQK